MNGTRPQPNVDRSRRPQNPQLSDQPRGEAECLALKPRFNAKRSLL